MYLVGGCLCVWCVCVCIYLACVRVYVYLVCVRVYLFRVCMCVRACVVRVYVIGECDSFSVALCLFLSCLSFTRASM